MQREGAGGQINDKRYERECIGNQNRAFRYGFIFFTQLGREEESGRFGAGGVPPFFLCFPRSQSQAAQRLVCMVGLLARRLVHSQLKHIY